MTITSALARTNRMTELRMSGYVVENAAWDAAGRAQGHQD